MDPSTGVGSRLDFGQCMELTTAISNLWPNKECLSPVLGASKRDALTYKRVWG
jgi:hypothetical protein